MDLTMNTDDQKAVYERALRDNEESLIRAALDLGVDLAALDPASFDPTEYATADRGLVERFDAALQQNVVIRTRLAQLSA